MAIAEYYLMFPNGNCRVLKELDAVLFELNQRAILKQ